jgi:hypothetical protein
MNWKMIEAQLDALIDQLPMRTSDGDPAGEHRCVEHRRHAGQISRCSPRADYDFTARAEPHSAPGLTRPECRARTCSYSSCAVFVVSAIRSKSRRY